MSGIEQKTAGTGRAGCIAGLALAMALGTAGATQAAATGTAGDLILDHVTVVDTHNGKRSPDMRVTIRDGRIFRVARAGGSKVGASARVIDARGKYLVPGYLDMHSHALISPDREGAEIMMLVNGITGFRQMSSTPELLVARKAGQLSFPGAPEILAMPGALLTYANAATVDAARAEVDSQKAQGADFIKTISVAPPVFFAALDEANKVGLPYSGHLSPGVDALKASEAGMRSIEHLGPTDTLLISCSTDEAAIRAQMARPGAAAPARTDLNAPPSGLDVQVLLANPLLSQMQTDPTFMARLDRVLATFSEAKCRQAAKLFVAHNTWQVPTLIRVRRMAFGDDAQYVADPNQRYLTPGARQLWKTVFRQFSDRVSPAARDSFKRLWAIQLKTTKIFDEEGVRMLAGSDVDGGFSLHHEFDLLSEAGLSPLRILQMTTLDGAQYMGRTATMGAVEAGKDANLVLLDADPIRTVQNLHRIGAVIRAGTFYSRQDLDALAAKTEARMKTPAIAALAAPDDL